MFESVRNATVHRSYLETKTTAAGLGAVEGEGPENGETRDCCMRRDIRARRYGNVVGEGRGVEGGDWGRPGWLG